MLSIHNLVKIYPGPVNALQGVSLNIGEGLFGLLGPNGAGKSTLMNTLAGLLEPTSGSVTLDGADIVKDPRIVRRQLGYLPQDFGFFPDLTGLRMLELMLKLKGVDGPGGRRKIAEALLERVNLSRAAKRKVSGYSGGMRQRLGLAQAIAGNPRLVIVDEPTAGLDPEERNRFLNLLAEIGENVVVILSTHIVEDVADLCPSMAILADGRILSQGAPLVLMDQLAGRVWKKTINRHDLEAVRQSYNVISSRLFSGATLVHVLADKAPGEGFEPVRGGLEDVYFSVLTEARRAA